MAVLEQPIGAVIEGVSGGTDVAVTLDGEEVEITLNSEVVTTDEQGGTYKGEQVLAGNDGSQNLTIPSGTTTIWFMPESGACYATINAAAAAASSGIYVPEDAVRIAGPFASITSCGVWAATGTSVHVLYEA